MLLCITIQNIYCLAGKAALFAPVCDYRLSQLSHWAFYLHMWYLFIRCDFFVPKSCMIFFGGKRLHDLSYCVPRGCMVVLHWEVAWFLCEERFHNFFVGGVVALFFFAEGFHDFLCAEKVCDFFCVERLRDFLCWEVAGFFVWRCCLPCLPCLSCLDCWNLIWVIWVILVILVVLVIW